MRWLGRKYATVTPAAKTTRATRKKRKTSPTATEISPTATETPRPAPRHPQSTLQSEGIDALAQIDTGCQVGDVINRRVLRDLRGEPHLRPTNTPLWMCSGLNNQCIESTHVLDIIVSFKKNSFQHTFSLPVRIAENSKVDLILGLQTIKKLNLVKLIPEFFPNPENIVTDKNMIHMSKIQRLDQSTNMVINQVNVPLCSSDGRESERRVGGS